MPPRAFCAAVMVVVAWAVAGPVFGLSDTWQLIINTGTTIVTFLIVFLIQHTQDRESRVLRLKIDELVRVVDGARTELVRADELSDSALERIEADLKREAARP